MDEILNVIFVGTASGFDKSDTDARRQKLADEVAGYDMFYKFLCKEGKPEDYGQPEFLTEKLHVSSAVLNLA